MISGNKYGILGINSNNEIFYREGITNINKNGKNQIKIDGLLYLSLGYQDFWDVNSKDEIFNRNNVSLSNQKGN